MLTLSLFKQYQEYRSCLRDSAVELSDFLEQFKGHIFALEEIIYEKCTEIELKILNFLLACNLSDEDVGRVIVWSEGIFPESDSKKVYKTLSNFLTENFKSINKVDKVESQERVVVINFLTPKKRPEFQDRISIKSSEGIPGEFQYDKFVESEVSASEDFDHLEPHTSENEIEDQQSLEDPSPSVSKSRQERNIEDFKSQFSIPVVEEEIIHKEDLPRLPVPYEALCRSENYNLLRNYANKVKNFFLPRQGWACVDFCVWNYSADVEFFHPIAKALLLKKKISGSHIRLEDHLPWISLKGCRFQSGPKQQAGHKRSLGFRSILKLFVQVAAIYCGYNLNEIVGPAENETEVSVKEKIMKKKIAYRVKCGLCDLLVPRGRIKVHIRRKHSNTRVPCNVCGKMVTEHLISQHLKIHKTECSEMFECQECDFTTHYEKYLLGHVKRNHQQKKFSCEVCGKLFGSGATLNTHMLNVHGDKLNCASCPYQTSNRGALQTHVMSHHSASVIYSCVYCSFETGDNGELHSHVGTLHPDKHASVLNFPNMKGKERKDNSQKPKLVYKCEYSDCDYRVLDKGSLRIHVEKKHLKIRHHCEFCDHVTGEKDSLKRHKLRKHPDHFKMYSCHLCSYKTQSKDLLQKHSTGHYGKNKL